MAGAGWRQFTRETLASADVQQYLMDQAVMRFASASERTTELVTPAAGMVAYLKDSDTYQGRTPSSAGADTGGTWRGFGRHWGSQAGALPAATSGDPSTAQPGDTCYSSLWRCAAVVSYLYQWRQLDIPQAATIAGRGTLATAATAGGAPFPEGFLIYVTSTKRLYVYMGDGTWRVAGGRGGTALTLTTGTGAPQTGWGSHSGVLQHHGNGMATVTFDIVRAGSAITPSTTGKITNSPLLQLPSGWEARQGSFIGAGSGGNRSAAAYMSAGSAVVTLTGVTGTADIATGATISISGTYPLATPGDLDD
jgi:hypothetical protein